MNYKPIHELLTDDELRSCKAIPEEDCHEVPGNFVKIAANGGLTKLAEQLISPKVTLPWILQYLGASSAFIGLLVPIRDAGSLLPQLALAGRIRATSMRKWWWVGAASIQAIALLIALFAFSLKGNAGGAWILGSLLIFSIASGVGSVAFKDVMGKVVPQGQRGQLLAVRSSLGGVLGLITGGWLFYYSDGASGIYITLFLGAALLWGAAAILYAGVKESPGSTEGGHSPLQSWKEGVEVFRSSAVFRRFVAVRSLMMGIPLMTPFLVLAAREQFGDSWWGLGLLVVVSALASATSSWFWGRWSDENAPLVFRWAGALALVAMTYAIAFSHLPDSWQIQWAYVPVFLINGWAYSGAKIARKTLIVDIAPDDKRTVWVSMANTSMGIVTLIAMGLGAMSEWWSTSVQLLIYGGLVVAGMVGAGSHSLRP